VDNPEFHSSDCQEKLFNYSFTLFIWVIQVILHQWRLYAVPKAYKQNMPLWPVTAALRKDTGTHQLFIHPSSIWSSICPHYSVSEACLNSQNGSNVECKPSLVHHTPDLHLSCACFESRPGLRLCDVSSWFLSVPQTKAVPHALNRLRPLRYQSFLLHGSPCRWRYTVKDTDTIVK